MRLVADVLIQREELLRAAAGNVPKGELRAVPPLKQHWWKTDVRAAIVEPLTALSVKTHPSEQADALCLWLDIRLISNAVV